MLGLARAVKLAIVKLAYCWVVCPHLNLLDALILPDLYQLCGCIIFNCTQSSCREGLALQWGISLSWIVVWISLYFFHRLIGRHLFILWLLVFLCLSLWCFGLNVDLIASVSEFTYLLFLALFLLKQFSLS